MLVCSRSQRVSVAGKVALELQLDPENANCSYATNVAAASTDYEAALCHHDDVAMIMHTSERPVIQRRDDHLWHEFYNAVNLGCLLELTMLCSW